MVSGINANNSIYVTNYSNGPKETDTKRKANNQKDAADSTSMVDKLVINNNEDKPVTYSKYLGQKKLEPSEIAALKSKAEMANENLRRLVEEIILKQTKGYKISTEIAKLQLSQEEVEAAKQSISEDGEYGVKAVSDRLVDFAIAVSGGDKSKLSELVSAIDEGFAAARKAWGGELPEICNQTYNETMRKLQEWSKEAE